MELFAGVMQTWRPVCALVLLKIFFSAAATGALIRNSSPGNCNGTADYRNGLVFCQTGKSEAIVQLDWRRPSLRSGWDALKRSPYNVASRRHARSVALPTVHGSVELAIDGQVRATIGTVGGELLVNVYAEAGSVAGIHHSGGKRVGVRKDAIGL